MSTTTWSARVEVRDDTVVLLIWSADDAAGKALQLALSQAGTELGEGALSVGPFYVEKLEIPSWYGRVGRPGADAELLARVARAARAALEVCGCHVEAPVARRAA